MQRRCNKGARSKLYNSNARGILKKREFKQKHLGFFENFMIFLNSFIQFAFFYIWRVHEVHINTHIVRNGPKLSCIRNVILNIVIFYTQDDPIYLFMYSQNKELLVKIVPG